MRLEEQRSQKSAQNLSKLPTSVDFQSQIENTVFILQLVESGVQNPGDIESTVFIEKRKSLYKWTCTVQNHVVQVSTI